MKSKDKSRYEGEIRVILLGATMAGSVPPGRGMA